MADVAFAEGPCRKQHVLPPERSTARSTAATHNVFAPLALLALARFATVAHEEPWRATHLGQAAQQLARAACSPDRARAGPSGGRGRTAWQCRTIAHSDRRWRVRQDAPFPGVRVTRTSMPWQRRPA